MEETTTKNRSLKDYFWLWVRGFAMGASDVVPGVSGGTMAFILGIYDELLESISAIDLPFIRNIVTFKWRDAFINFPWQFLVAVALGIFSAVFTMASALHWALEEHPVYIWAFFFGLIVASIIAVRKRVQVWNVVNIGATIIAALGAYVLVGLTPSETPHTPLLLFLSGAFAICAMILPGISGAFILVLLGKYAYILAAVKNFDLITVGLVGIGAVIGLLVFVRFLRWLLHKNHDLVVAILTGFMIGSLRKVWPWKTFETISDSFILETNFFPTVFNSEVGFAILLMVAGMTFITVLDHVANKRQEIASA